MNNDSPSVLVKRSRIAGEFKKLGATYNVLNRREWKIVGVQIFLLPRQIFLRVKNWTAFDPQRLYPG
jgi:hypothetical protein